MMTLGLDVNIFIRISRFISVLKVTREVYSGVLFDLFLRVVSPCPVPGTSSYNPIPQKDYLGFVLEGFPDIFFKWRNISVLEDMFRSDVLTH